MRNEEFGIPAHPPGVVSQRLGEGGWRCPRILSPGSGWVGDGMGEGQGDQRPPHPLGVDGQRFRLGDDSLGLFSSVSGFLRAWSDCSLRGWDRSDSRAPS